ncbi:MAG: hypothetical protein QXZ70_06915, partial [Candidatus Bathyarchaeia archaeon]
LGDLAHLIVTGHMDVSFLFWSQGSRLTLCSVAVCVVDGVSSNTPNPLKGLEVSDSRSPAHQPILNYISG